MDRVAGLLVGLLALAAVPVPHEDLLRAAELGSPDFRPSVSRPIGWRGDGSGRYPAADPPVHWDRCVETLIRQFRCQAARPADPDKAGGKKLPLFVEGNARGHYSLCDWLVLGAVSPPPDAGKVDKMLERETLSNEAGMDPAEGDRVGELTWRRAAGANVDLRKLLGPPKSPAFAAGTMRGLTDGYAVPGKNLAHMAGVPSALPSGPAFGGLRGLGSWSATLPEAHASGQILPPRRGWLARCHNPLAPASAPG